MKAFCDIIDNVLDEVIKPLLNGIDPADWKTVTKCYQNRLEALYADIYETLSGKDGDRAFVEFIRDSESFFLNSSATDKTDLLIYGDIYNRVHSLGMDALNMAIAYKQSGSVDPLYESKRSTIIEALKWEMASAGGKQRLTDFIANELNDSVCDLEFASGSAEHMSQRLFELIREV